MQLLQLCLRRFVGEAHEQYVARVCGEIRSVRQRLGGAAIPEQVDSIYLGGGTPSVLSPALVGELAHTLRQEFAISPGAEITLECAPGQLDDPALEAMLGFGRQPDQFWRPIPGGS